ncbi:MAG TPA: RNA polymerase factor sigma-54 [Polyangia bacterium]|jgi:RNA polymerase sigma-54 factor|nr:RNA polymerase factor sigma-54 [Polyangia bacterium]
MSIEIKQHLKLSQQLVMTPQLQQAIKLLQLSRMELVDMVRDEMLENPILEDSVESANEQAKGPELTAPVEAASHDVERVGETEMPMAEIPQEKVDSTSEVKADTRSGEAVADFDWETYLDNQAQAAPMPSYKSNNEDLPSLESTLTRGTSLFDHLEWQLKLSHFTLLEDGIAMLIIGNINPSGYLEEPLEDLSEEAGVDVALAESVLRRIQEFDPVGVAARSLEECLMIQARHIGADDDVVVGIIQRHLPNLEKKNYTAIAKDLLQPVEEIYEAAKVVQTFDPKPGRQYTSDEPTYITPDVYIHKVGDKYFVVANDDGLPKLKISDFYRTALAGGSKAREYIQEKLRSAQWLIRSIQQRQRTIVRVTESILKFQRDFFDKGTAHLKPLILRDVAEDIGMHESTVSRVTTNKYVHTPQGIYELKYFFNSGITRTDGDDLASEAVKLKIKQIIGQENVKHPHSDQKIVELLRDQNIEIARRTVAKYREQLRILSSSKRRQVY